MDLGIISEEFLREYCILLVNSMHGNVDAALLWIRLLETYVVIECNINRIKSCSCIFFHKDGKGDLELVISVHVDYAFMAGKP